MQHAIDYFYRLNQDYLAVHQAKEDLFWQHYMGTGGAEVSGRFAAVETAYKRFIAEPKRPAELRHLISQLATAPSSPERDQMLHGLRGWARFFDCNVIEDPLAQGLMDEIIAAENDLYARRKTLTLKHLLAEQDPPVAATLGELLTNQANNDSERCRQSSQQALRDLEQWLLHNGFPELVSLRNRFARQMGYRNFFDYKVNKTEQMTPEQLFAILDSFERQTRDGMQASLRRLASEKGDAALAPWNIRYASAGDVTRQLDPYLPFADSLRR